ncbi:TonB-dependent receptor plug domain-containing protein [Pelagicoccus sp. SDUM812005]|uniref:TonB-dependent receptor plug domain-containing protein n=1 Tax=Pelagicoccus sp. SDUM812005 TaxID=3041257 RepID=UPI00280E1864|nr:TonB-dependent receptor plug domain-containing protein [Pelagicoccus sp. SDUM812005]MDQ8183103.1 hypothetical protein [Pelagicoccus sp. SDUM812005]
MPLAFGLFTGIGSYAQNSTLSEGDDDDEIFELSPFTVSSREDNGYYATQTLAGSRLKTATKDLSASLSIVTEDFMKDTNATDLEGVLLFQANTEVSGLGGNFSGSQGAGTGLVIGELARDNTSGGVTRVRGLASADLTRDYFRTDIAFDAYNIDRVTVQRGANAVLFGLGSPGGIVNNSLIKARMYDFGHVKLKTDEFGTLRGEFRYNKEIVEDKFAIVVAGLKEDEKYEQKEAYYNDDRLYLSALFRPFDDTFSIRASIEDGERSGASPRAIPPGDLISGWYDFGKPIYDTPTEAADAYFETEGINGLANSRQIVAPLGSLGPTYFFMDPNSSEPTYAGRIYMPTSFVDGGSDTAAGSWYSTMLSMRPINYTIQQLGIYPDGTPIPYAGSGSLYDQYTGAQITDRSIFDYRKHLLDGGLSTSFSDFQQYSVSMEKLMFDNRLAFELAYNSEEFQEGQFNILRGDPSGESIMIDFNPYLGISEESTGGELIPNPNYGGVAVVSRAENGISWADRSSLRGTVGYDFRFSDFFEEDSFWERLLGHADLTGVYQERELSTEEFYTRDSPDISDMVGAVGTIDTWGGRLGQYHALSIPGLPDGMSLLDYNDISELGGINIQPINGSQVLPSSGTFQLFNTATQTWDDAVINTYTARAGDYENVTFSASKNREKIESKVLNGIFYLWDDNIVVQRAWREDTVKSVGVGAPGRSDYSSLDNLDADSYVLGDYGDPTSGQIRTWGVVMHTPDFLLERLKNWDVSLHYGTGENFRVTSGRKNVLNGDITPETGSTKEMGFSLTSPQGNFLAKFNWYETGTLYSSYYTSAVVAPENILVNLARQLDNPDNVDQGFTAADAQAMLPEQGVIDLQGVIFDWANAEATSNANSFRNSTQDTLSKGVEVEVFYSPTDNWTNVIKVSKQKTSFDNTSPVLTQWYEEFVKPTWIDSDFAQNYYINDTSDTTLAQYAEQAIAIPLQASKQLDGSPAPEQREWSVIATSKYRFEDFLGDYNISNFEVGGTVRYQDEAIIGFAATTNVAGQVIRDLSNPYYTPSETYLDMFVSFDTKVFEQDLSLQLYVSDLTDHTDLVGIYANPDGSQTYRISEGRVVSLSATYSF